MKRTSLSPERKRKRTSLSPERKKQKVSKDDNYYLDLSKRILPRNTTGTQFLNYIKSLRSYSPINNVYTNEHYFEFIYKDNVYKCIYKSDLKPEKIGIIYCLDDNYSIGDDIDNFHFLEIYVSLKLSNLISKNRQFKLFTTNPLDTILRINDAWFCFFHIEGNILIDEATFDCISEDKQNNSYNALFYRLLATDQDYTGISIYRKNDIFRYQNEDINKNRIVKLIQEIRNKKLRDFLKYIDNKNISNIVISFMEQEQDENKHTLGEFMKKTCFNIRKDKNVCSNCVNFINMANSFIEENITELRDYVLSLKRYKKCDEID